jgi:predicted alpha/beta-fold hydrolase
MPLVESSYRAPLLLGNPHVQTCLPTLFRRVEGVSYEGDRLDLPDGAFLNLDWARVGSRRLAILAHGWEGHTQRCYMLGMVRALNRAGWDCLCWLFRWCGGITNRTPTCTHSGSADDVRAVVDHARATGRYESIALVGFSLGANINLNYLGREPERVAPEICSSIGFSAPLELKGCGRALARPVNAIYRRRFMKSLAHKVQRMAAAFPDAVDVKDVGEFLDFDEFDERYTAPLHGFANAEEYRRLTSPLFILPRIQVPSLIVNADNDTFLGPESYPSDVCAASPNLFLEIPRSGGHCGFVDLGGDEYWSETRAREFLAETCS